MRERMTAIVGARISEFRRKMAEVNAIARRTPKNIWIRVKAETNDARKRIMKVANFMQDIDYLSRNLAGGFMFAVSPAIIPILASLVATVAMLGPMLGTVAGSTFALATAFGFAGTAAVAFGAMAIPTITKLFDEQQKLNKEQRKAKKSFETLKSTWKSIMKELETPILEAFTKSMQIANKVVEKAEPLFHASAKAVNNLLDSLSKSIDSPPIQKFFDYMNKEAGPLFETTGKAIGNFMQGFMSMMVAFGPLAEKTAQGFLNMSRDFATWGATLDKNKQFQKFVKYVEENMPKIKSIVGDAIAGLTNLFAAFGPLASDMMTGLQGLMERFREWSSTLDENKSFQKFIDYIRENGPKVMELFGNLVDLFVELAEAIAPAGSDMLDFLNKMIPKLTEFLDNNPKLAKFVGYMIVFAGIVKALLGPLFALLPLLAPLAKGLGGAAGGLGKLGKKLGKKISTKIDDLGRSIGTKLLPKLKDMGKTIGKKVIPKLGRFGSKLLGLGGPMGLVAAGVIELGFIIYDNWDKIAAWTEEKWDLISTNVKDGWENMKKNTSEAIPTIKKNVKDGWDNMKTNVSNAMTNIKTNVRDGWNNAKTNVGESVNTIKGNVAKGFQNILENVGIKTEDAKEKADKNFQNLAKAMKVGLDEGKGWVETALGDIKDKFENTSLYESGKKIIGSAIEGINHMKDKVSGAVENVAGVIRSYWPFSPAKEGPLRDLHKIDFAWAVTKSINDSKRSIQNSMDGLLNSPTIAAEGFDMNVGAPTKYESRESTTVNMEGVFEGAKITIREDADIDKIAQALGQRLNERKRARGIR